MARTFVIAEAGSCHDGDINKALRLIEAARDACADAVKFQFWSSADRLADRRRVPANYREVYRRYQVPAWWLPTLADESWNQGLEFLCTVYLPEDVAVIAPLVKRFKIASFEASDEAFLRAHAPFEKPFIVSTGMMDNVDRFAFDRRVQLLHCVSAYPAPPEAMNLSVLQDGFLGFEYEPSPFHGLSDHSRHPWMGALAVAAGAVIIEAHLRLEDTDLENPDYATAFTPAEFSDYVSNIRFAERVMGDGVKHVMECEREMAQFRVGGAGT